jgi:hypothetical protein
MQQMAIRITTPAKARSAFAAPPVAFGDLKKRLLVGRADGMAFCAEGAKCRGGFPNAIRMGERRCPQCSS